MLAAVIGGAVVGLLCAILLVMFIVYRYDHAKEHSSNEVGTIKRLCLILITFNK